MPGTTLNLNDDNLKSINNLQKECYGVFKKETLEGNEVKRNGILTDEGLLNGRDHAKLLSPTYASLKDTINQYSEDKSEENLKENVKATFEDYQEIDFWGMVKEIKNALKTTAIKIIKIISGWFAGWVKSL